MNKHRQLLNSGQLELLELVCRYRFVTVDQLVRYLKLRSRTSLHKKINILLAQDYVSRRYDDSYKIARRPSAYYVTPKGLKLLMDNQIKYIALTTIKSAYKDKTATEAFIDECIETFTVAMQIEDSVENLKAFSQRQVGMFKYFPKPLPDLYLVLTKGKRIKRFFLYEFDDKKPSFTIAKKIQQLVEYAESGQWDVTGNKFPALLCVCTSPRLERSVQRRFEYAIEQSDEELSVYTTTNRAILNIKNSNIGVWSDIDAPEDPLNPLM